MLVKSIKVIFLVAYAFVFGEWFIRIMDPQPLMPRYVQAADDGIRMNVPNVVYRQKTPEVSVEVRINSQGIRSDREISLAKEPGVCRIVLLGDSFMMGYEVDLENSLAYLLEENLNQHKLQAEVVNLAVSGFGTAEHLVALQARGAQFKPDLVVMEWHSTDPKDNKRSNLFKMDSEGGVIRKNDTYLPAVSVRERLMKIPGYEWLIGNSHLYSAVRERAALLVKDLLAELRSKRSDKLTESAVQSSPKVAKSGSFDLLDEQLVLAVDEEAKKMGAEFLLMDVPMKSSGTTLSSAFNLLDLGMLENIIKVSAFPEFKKLYESGTKLYYEKGHGHWTIAGNQVIADVVARAIKERNLCQ